MARREDVLNALSQIARNIQNPVGESLATVEKHSTPLAEATTPSLEALKAYSTGMKVIVSSGNAAAIPFTSALSRSIPNSPWRTRVWGLRTAVGESVLSAQSTTKAWQLRDRVSDREKFLSTSPTIGRSREIWKRRTKPSSCGFRRILAGRTQCPGFVGGLSTHGTGRFERAIEASQKEIAADPDFGLGYGNLASSYFFLGRFEEAESALQRATERKLENP